MNSEFSTIGPNGRAPSRATGQAHRPLTQTTPPRLQDFVKEMNAGGTGRAKAVDEEQEKEEGEVEVVKDDGEEWRS